MHVEMFGVVLGIHLRESVGDDREVRLRFANGNPALQVTQHEPIFWEPAAELSFRAAGLFGEPQVRIAPGEARRHDADQRARRAVQDERGIEYLGVCRSEEHTSELQSRLHLVCRLLLEKKKELRFLSGSRSSSTCGRCPFWALTIRVGVRYAALVGARRARPFPSRMARTAPTCSSDSRS